MFVLTFCISLSSELGYIEISRVTGSGLFLVYEMRRLTNKPTTINLIFRHPDALVWSIVVWPIHVRHFGINGKTNLGRNSKHTDSDKFPTTEAMICYNEIKIYANYVSG